jgi:hypothetical protein
MGVFTPEPYAQCHVKAQASGVSLQTNVLLAVDVGQPLCGTMRWFEVESRCNGRGDQAQKGCSAPFCWRRTVQESVTADGHLGTVFHALS